MKKLFYLLVGLFSTTVIRAQFITTNPANTPINLQAPVNVSEDLNLANNKAFKINNIPVLKAFGAGNIGMGQGSGNIATLGDGNVSIGLNSAGNSLAGTNNVHIGASAGFATSGSRNVGIGNGTLYNNTGNFNAALGYDAGRFSTGAANVFIGTSTGQNNTGDYGIIIGTNAGQVNKGNANVFIGNNTAQTHELGDYNTFVGSYATSTNINVQRATAIGAFASANVNDAIVLGYGPSKIGIGTSSPSSRLHVVCTNTPGENVRFEGLPADGVGGLATQFVVIDPATGNLYRYSGAAPARIGAPEGTTSLPTSFTENWTLKNDFLYNKNKKGIIIGEGISSLPKGYGMYVTDGILTEKVKVAIKNSSDWADYVFNKDYKKMTLTEVEKFIKVNNHLPNMLSATEMVSEGNDLAKTDAKLLEKIEELTLYMIEMKKENAQMKRQINTLKRKMK